MSSACFLEEKLSEQLSEQIKTLIWFGFKAYNMEPQTPDCFFCKAKIQATDDRVQIQCGARVCNKCAAKRSKQADKTCELNRKIERENWKLAEQKKPLKELPKRFYSCNACNSSHREDELVYLF